MLVKRNLDFDEVAALETHQLELPGVSLRITPSRSYPYGPMLAHVLGYVGEATQDDLDRDRHYRPGDVVGKAGLEKAWEPYLRGVHGGQQVEVDALGRELRVLDEEEAIPGDTLVLTSTSTCSRRPRRRSATRPAPIVALDPRNGDVLAMVSRPAFDPNVFTGGIKPERWHELTAHPRHPLNARATQGQYPPGSTFKIIMADGGARGRGHQPVHPHPLQRPAAVRQPRLPLLEEGRARLDERARRAGQLVRRVLLPGRASGSASTPSRATRAPSGSARRPASRSAPSAPA